MPTRFGAVIANAMGAGAKVLGYGIYYLLRVIYRRKEKLIALAVVAAVVAVGLLLYWLLR